VREFGGQENEFPGPSKFHKVELSLLIMEMPEDIEAFAAV
jgi:hypothetical protein